MADTQLQAIQIQLNGEGRTVPKGLSILELLKEIDVSPDRVAVELNRHIVRQPDWETTPVADGAQVEIVQFVGGG
jgi:thiamine biosynthesis protein ThiS